ncbi:DUF305 domain-containing protein [Thermostaphylospora chromogena]|uniref:Uncharacterized conserved protein, DUF305 family n=1 Tax=Thermostaphylospora chromogena TaxID=35622 RepID=A0A1H1CZE8_9ACTN|nr:DUF305 domain-containing protein [Thermostaphylospora chromogena]SDQ68926.1 Uncharacterized conserved protein, DUF305 family [Thermostaphylospora chromogena]
MPINRAVLRKLVLSTATGIGALVLLTACGGAATTSAAPDHVGMPATPTASASTQAAAFNQADVMFAQMMIPHHRQAVEMAELAETRAADPEIKELAQKIKAAQDPEITTMRGWLTAWGAAEMPMDGDHSGHGMPGMMTKKDMARLKASKGGKFDRMFAQMMIEHHDGAIDMAKTELSQGTNPEAKDLAETIIAAQQGEIDQMKQILERL